MTRVKADNPLYGSSLIEYVSGVRIVWVSKDLFVASYVLVFAGFIIFCVYSDNFFFFFFKSWSPYEIFYICWYIKGLFGLDV